MRSIITALLLSIAMVGGCTVSAGISRGQDLESVVVGNDDFRQVHNSSVRIRAYENGKLAWMGSGLVYKILDNRAFILSNQHVCGDADKITGEFFRNGRSLGEFDMRVDMCKQSDDGIDIGVVSCNIGKTLAGIEAVPFAKTKVVKGDEVFFVGSARGEWPKGKLGRVIESTDMHFYSSPTSIPGDSGSGMVRFDEDGEPEIVGLIAWYSTVDGKRVCMSMHSSVVLSVLAGGEVPDHGDVPPTAEGTERLVQGLLERLREMREENRRERESLRDRLSQMQLDNAMQQQEAQLFRDRWKKQQDNNQQQADGLQDKIMGQFTTLKALIKFAKWSFYALVAALLVSIFAGQGWMTRVIVTIFKVIFNIIRGTFAIVADAVSRPIKDTKSPSEALDNLREEIATIDDAP